MVFGNKKDGTSDDFDDLPTRTAVADPRTSGQHRRLGRLLLQIVDGPERGKEHRIELLPGKVLKGGRGDANDIVLRDEQVSVAHFDLVVRPEGLVLRDLGSKNGTRIQGVRIVEAPVALEDTFRVGETSLRIVATDMVNVAVSLNNRFGEMYGDSPIMRELFAELERISSLPQRLPVLITGETGTGKELVARGLHEASKRRGKPFVVFDCTSVPRELAEAEIRGYMRGAFTGSNTDHAGIFEQADGGTLFIDELGELPLDLQAKLLRPLERGEITRVKDPGDRPRKVDVRVIAATHRDLRRMVCDGTFREDLYWRLAVKIIELPPLRERGNDVVVLARRFLRDVCKAERMPPKDLSRAACERLCRHRWSGNVRELRGVITCAALLSPHVTIQPEDLRLDDVGASRDDRQLDGAYFVPIAEAKERFEREYYKVLLPRLGRGRGWVARGAAITGLDRTGFVKALKRLGLYPDHLPETVDD